MWVQWELFSEALVSTADDLDAYSQGPLGFPACRANGKIPGAVAKRSCEALFSRAELRMLPRPTQVLAPARPPAVEGELFSEALVSTADDLDAYSQGPLGFPACRANGKIPGAVAKRSCEALN